ncbi:MAG: tetratricopeptide repeat protein, partial [Chrysiogenetes bacterium]|nr:tetratricopeptide repeat protein [Chrysiogenetes bacterium]
MPPGKNNTGPGRWIALVLVSAFMGTIVAGALYWANNREKVGHFAGRVGGRALEDLGVIHIPDATPPGGAIPELSKDEDSIRYEWRYGADVPDEQSVEELELARSLADRVPDFPDRFREVLSLTREYQFMAARGKLDALIADFGKDVPPAVRRAHELLLLTWGDRLLHEGRNAQAALILLELEALNPKDRSFERPLGLAFYRAGDREKAFPFLSAVYARAGARAGINFELGELYYFRGELDKARPLLESVRGANQHEAARLLAKIGRESYVEGEFREIEGYEGGNFRVSFDGTQNVRAAYGTRVILEQARRDIGRQFGFYPKDKIAVVLYTRVQYNRALSAP